MGYNTNLERAINIPSFESLGTAETYLPLPNARDLRISIPFFAAQAGATAQKLSFLQVKEVDYLAAEITQGATEIQLQMNQEDLSGRWIAIEDSEGVCFFSEVTGTTGQTNQLAEPYDEERADQDCKVYIFHKPTEGGNQVFPLRANELEQFSAGCPGIVLAEEIGYPLILHISNENNETVQFHGGTIALINK